MTSFLPQGRHFDFLTVFGAADHSFPTWFFYAAESMTPTPCLSHCSFIFSSLFPSLFFSPPLRCSCSSEFHEPSFPSAFTELATNIATMPLTSYIVCLQLSITSELLGWCPIASWISPWTQHVQCWPYPSLSLSPLQFSSPQAEAPESSACLNLPNRGHPEFLPTLPSLHPISHGLRWMDPWNRLRIAWPLSYFLQSL